jgi:uncharacterized protein YjbJ (UPF0337 family)
LRDRHPRSLTAAKWRPPSNKGQDLKGKGKEAVGKVTGDKDLERKGKADQVKSAAKDAGEKVKDTVSKAKDALTD